MSTRSAIWWDASAFAPCSPAEVAEPLPWTEFFIPLDLDDPRNYDRHDPGGDRIRVRLNGADLADFVVQYETPTVAVGPGQGHAAVLRSDGTHAPHYDWYDRFGRTRTTWLPPDLSPKQTVDRAIRDIKGGWRAMRRNYYGGLS